MRSFGPDVKSLLRKLLLGYHKYFHNDALNSDGRKIFCEVLRMLIYEHPELRRIIYKARRSFDLNSVLKIAEIVLGDEARELLRIGIYGIYDYEI